MNEANRLLNILQVAVPNDTALTVQSEIKILEVLGIVKDPQLISAMNLVSSLVPPSTPATLKGLIQILGSLMRMSNKAKAAHHESVSSVLSKLDSVPDYSLTFGSFLSVCQSLIASDGKASESNREKTKSR
jgi:hypothetical protein